jgi:cytochrome c oxidase assembly protein Cox11
VHRTRCGPSSDACHSSSDIGHLDRNGVRGVRGIHGRYGLCGGAALQLVLQDDRLWRRSAGRQRSSAGISDRKIAVRFDANMGAGLPWRFEPERTSIEVRLGEVVTVFYKVTNLSERETAGQAAYNVTPTTAGAYFTKINCFCFTEQHLAPRETRDMTVVFYVDPALMKDAEQDDLNTITLSYTFFPLRPPPPRVASPASDSYPEHAGGTPALAGKDRPRQDRASPAGAERKI